MVAALAKISLLAAGAVLLNQHSVGSKEPRLRILYDTRING